MQLQTLGLTIRQALRSVLTTLERSVKQGFQPVQSHQVLGTVADITRSQSELIAENAFLRQPLIVLQRQTNRPVLTPRDRTLLVLMASRFRMWREALIIVKPDTLLAWHRQGFRLFCRHKSKVRTPQPRVPEHVIALIHSMALDHRLWGSKRIRDELRKLGYRLTRRTVAKYMCQVRPTLPPRKPSQTWAAF
jgi:putative transposase